MISNEYMQFLDNLKPRLATTQDLDNAWQTFIFIWDKSQVLDFDTWELDRLKNQISFLASLGLGLLVHEDVLSKVNSPYVAATDIVFELRELHKNKNAGYSGNDPDPWKNFRVVNAFGIPAVIGCLTRLCDKYSRYTTLLEDPTLDKVNESLEDSLLDFIAYCGIMICLLGEL